MNNFKWHRIDTKAKLKKLDKKLMKDGEPRHKILAYDTETNGLLFYKNVIVGFSLAYSEDEAFYIPLLDWKRDKKSLKTKSINKEKWQVYENGWFRDVWNPDQIYPEEVTQEEYKPPQFILKLFERWTRKANLVMHNAPFDCLFTKKHFGINLKDNLFCDTQLLAHFVNELESKGLKKRASLRKEELGFDVDAAANEEQKEMNTSVIRNGGKEGHVWRGDPKLVAKYGARDTSLTLGILRTELKRLRKDFNKEQQKFFFEKEVMPLCREVTIPMRERGVRVDVPYFRKLYSEVVELMNQYEDQAVEKIKKHVDLNDFDKGKSFNEIVSTKKLIRKIADKEGIALPTQKGKEGQEKESLAKASVEQKRKEEPHWLWDYVLGEGEIKYSTPKLNKIKQEIFEDETGKRHHFSINSDEHMRWVLFTKLGHDKASVPQTESATEKNPIPSLNAEVLKDYFLEQYDFIHDVMMYRKLGKLRSNYIYTVVNLHNNGWMHMDMNQDGTPSGRFSCSGGFNLQTLPKLENLEQCPECSSKDVVASQDWFLLAKMFCNDCESSSSIICYSAIKAGFIAPEGYKIGNADLESLEVKCFAEASSEPSLKGVYKEGLDIYSKVYCDTEDEDNEFSPNPESESFLKKVRPDLRDKIKQFVLASTYGAESSQVSNIMDFKKEITDNEGNKKVIPDVEKGKNLREKYLEAYPNLKKYMTDCEESAKKKGYVEDPRGRRKYYKYAPAIYEILKSYGVKDKKFVEAKRKELAYPDLEESLGLDEHALREFAKYFGISMNKIAKKGYWAYVRSLYKKDLNNAKNHVIQHLASRVANAGMLTIRREFDKKGIDGWIFIQIHDEIGCYINENQAEEAIKIIQNAMENNEVTQEIEVPMKAEPVIAETLREAK